MLRQPPHPDPHIVYIRITPLSMPVLAVDDVLALTATAHYSDNREVRVTDVGTWTSSDPSVLTVDAIGVVTAVSFGSATISFTYRGTEAAVDATVAGSAPVVVTDYWWMVINAASS